MSLILLGQQIDSSIAIFIISVFSFVYFSYLFGWNRKQTVFIIGISALLSLVVSYAIPNTFPFSLILFSSFLLSLSLTFNLASLNFIPVLSVVSPIFLAIYLIENQNPLVISSSLSLSLIIWFVSIEGGLLSNPFNKYPMNEKLKKINLTYSEKNETQRQLFHMILGFIVLAISLIAGKSDLLSILSVLVLFGTFLFNLKFTTGSAHIFDLFLNKFSRKGELAGLGSLNYLLGITFAVSFIGNFSFALSVALILAVGDAMSSLVGKKFGEHKLFYNPSKSIEGMFGFVFFSILFSYFLIGYVSIVLSIILAIVESLPIGKVDDNLSVPIVGTFLSAFI